MLWVESSPNSHAEITVPKDSVSETLGSDIARRKFKGGALFSWTRSDDVMTKRFWPEIAQQNFVVWRPSKTMPQSVLLLAAYTSQQSLQDVYICTKLSTVQLLCKLSLYIKS